LKSPTNDDTDESIIRASLAQLPDGPHTLVRIAAPDRDPASPGAAFTHFDFPDYLVRPPSRTGEVASIGEWIEQPDLGHPAFFYFGVRCYAQFRPEGSAVPPGDNLQPACARRRERFRS